MALEQIIPEFRKQAQPHDRASDAASSFAADDNLLKVRAGQ
jgi:hypothetical protein